jgi:hypothetical protein
MAEVVPFPSTRRVAFIRKHAVRMAGLPELTAWKHMTHQVEVQRRTMLRRGIADDAVDRECAALEQAILAELRCLTIGGVA